MHLAASSVISTGVFYFSNSWAAAIASFITGIFIDVDHFLDYFLHCGINFDIKKFYNVCIDISTRKVIIFLHSYELLALFWIIIYIFNLGFIWKGMAIGYAQHILFDQIVNSRSKIHKLGYFFVYRCKKNFERLQP